MNGPIERTIRKFNPGTFQPFAKTERRVYLAVIDLWQPSTTGEVAARARMDVRAVSALLGLHKRRWQLKEDIIFRSIYFAPHIQNSIPRTKH